MAADERALVGNAASAKQVADADRTVKQRALQSDACWKTVWSTVEGRRVFRELLRQCGMQSGGFTADRAHFNEGQRNVGLYITGRICEIDEELYFTMMREAQKEKKE